ncbi:MAG: ABC transporter substrate-binding protein [Chloroflexi bacterium]|nr:ABC transporter substrate-binding protein [Chloroflexota bacterium]
MTQVLLSQGQIEMLRRGRKRIPFKRLGIAAAIALLVFSGCGKSGSSTTTSPTATAKTTTQSSTQTTAKTSTAQTTAKATTTLAPTQSSSAPYGTLTILAGSFGNESFDPVTADVTHAQQLLSPMFDYLSWIVYSGGNRQNVPRLLEKWEMASNGLSWTYYVRKGIKFHIGDVVTSKDVKYSLERYMLPQSVRPDLRNAVSRIDIVDDFTLRLYTKGVQLFMPQMHDPSSPGQGLVMPKDYVDKNGLDYFKKRPVGTGPWKFVSYTPGYEIQFEAADNHWRQTPAFKNLAVLDVPEEATRIAMLKTAGADLSDVSLDNAKVLESAGFTSFVTGYIVPVVQLHGVFDPRGTGMAITDLRVRQALAFAIDSQDINKNFFYGKMTSALPPRLTEDSSEIDIPYWRDYLKKSLRYDPEQAKLLLAQAGYANGLTIRLYSSVIAGAPYITKIAEVVQSYWAKVGVKAQIVPVEFGTYTSWRSGPALDLVGQAFVNRNLSGSTLQGLANGFLSTGSTVLLGKGTTAESKRFDQLIASANTEVDLTKRGALIAEAVKICVDSYTMLVIGNVPGVGVMGPRATGTVPAPLPGSAITLFADVIKHRQ